MTGMVLAKPKALAKAAVVRVAPNPPGPISANTQVTFAMVLPVWVKAART